MVVGGNVFDHHLQPRAKQSTEWVILNYAGNVCDACETGDLVIGLQRSIRLSTWCVSWAGLPVAT